MNQIAVIKYSDTALPTGSATFVLWSTGVNPGVSKLLVQGAGVGLYVLKLRNSHAGTLLVEKSDDNVTFTTVHQQTMAPSATNDVNYFTYAIGAEPYLRVRWTNGGVTQTTFDVMQSLCCDERRGDQHRESAARLCGPVADATNNFAYSAGTTSEQFAIPAAWLGRRIDISVVGTALTVAGLAPTCWFLFGTADTVDVDRTAFVTGTPPAFTGSAVIGRPIAHGETRDYYVDPSWTHFAVEADVAATGIYIFLSDYPPQHVG